ncbi:MAG: hypothetical protein ACKOAD_05655 [Gammaproteobacteria bacterium]
MNEKEKEKRRFIAGPMLGFTDSASRSVSRDEVAHLGDENPWADSDSKTEKTEQRGGSDLNHLPVFSPLYHLSQKAQKEKRITELHSELESLQQSYNSLMIDGKPVTSEEKIQKLGIPILKKETGRDENEDRVPIDEEFCLKAQTNLLKTELRKFGIL